MYVLWAAGTENTLALRTRKVLREGLHAPSFIHSLFYHDEKVVAI